jgi:hypothetical protein
LQEIANSITILKKSNELYTLSYWQFVVPLAKAVQELNQKNKTNQWFCASKNWNKNKLKPF